MIIAVQNLSTSVSDADVYSMTLLVDRQVRDHVAPAWGIQPPFVEFYKPSADPAVPAPHFTAIIGILDDADQAGDLGWHTEGPDATVYGRVFARPVLANGGNALTNQLSVCSVLSHEVIETIGDPACDGWHQRADGTLAARELCDPVEGDSYEVTVTSEIGTVITGTVSDFVLPAWFDPDAAPGATDYMGLLTAPFGVRPTGYVITMAGTTVSEAWGEEYPRWRIVTKESPAARTARRDPSVVPVVPAVPQEPTSLA
jgi:hypothetical protein